MNQSPDPAWMRHMYCGLSSYDSLGTGTWGANRIQRNTRHGFHELHEFLFVS